MERISSVIITLNEESTIADCVRSLRPFSDEILVVDSFSTDRTAAVCRGLGCRVVTRKFDDFIRQKNFALSRAQYDRIFFIDADERVPPELADRVKKIKQAGFPADAYWIPRRNLYLGGRAWYGGWGSDGKFFLFDRRKCRYRGGGVHEFLDTEKAKIARLGPFVLHRPYANLGHHLRKIDSYSSLFAKARAGRPRPLLFLEVLFRPAFKFIKCYFLQAAFLAGTRGFIFSVLAAFSVFMKYSKLMEYKFSSTDHRKRKAGRPVRRGRG